MFTPVSSAQLLSISTIDQDPGHANPEDVKTFEALQSEGDAATGGSDSPATPTGGASADDPSRPLTLEDVMDMMRDSMAYSIINHKWDIEY